MPWTFENGVYKRWGYDIEAIRKYYREYRGIYHPLKTYSADCKARERYNYITKYWKQTRLGIQSMLDVGCGEGNTMKIFKKHGWDVYGVEESLDHIEHARKYGTVFKAGHISDELRFDVIHMGHVLEHVENPKEFLMSYQKLLKPGGVIYIEVPNTPYPDTLWWDNDRIMWRLHEFEESGHLWEFTVGGLVSTVREAGLEPVAFGRMAYSFNEDANYMLLNAKPRSWNPFRLIPACVVACNAVCLSFMLGSLQMDIPTQTRYLGVGDYIRMVAK